MLLNFGVDPTIPDARSRNIIDILKKNKNFDAVKAVSNHIEKHTSSSVELEGTVWTVLFLFLNYILWMQNYFICNWQ